MLFIDPWRTTQQRQQILYLNYIQTYKSDEMQTIKLIILQNTVVLALPSHFTSSLYQTYVTVSYINWMSTVTAGMPFFLKIILI